MNLSSLMRAHPFMTGAVAASGVIGGLVAANHTGVHIGPITSGKPNGDSQIGLTSLVGASAFAGFLATAMLSQGHPAAASLNHVMSGAMIGAGLVAGARSLLPQ